MGLFSDLKAMNDLQQIKHGGVGKLSLSQITCFIVNMPEDLNTLAFKLPFMTETLVKNGVISKEEAITLNNKYNDLCMRKMQDKVVSE